MIKRIMSIFLLCSLFLFIGMGAYAETLADPVFLQAIANLQQSKEVTFSLMTNYSVDSIRITSCTLQKKVDGIWTTDQLLPAPSDEDQGLVYSSTISYSSYIVNSGTYRIKYIAEADGHSITRYSNSRTF